jgi:ankyrin repeat protein
MFLEAVKSGDEALVTSLLEEDPNLARLEADNGVSVVLLALYHGKPKIAELLALRRTDLSVFEAAALGCLDRLRSLLDADPSASNARASDGFHPLGLACFFGQERAARLLIEHGAEISTPSENAFNVQPIHSAAARKASSIVRLLLEHGADPNARQQKGYTPLHSAAQNGDTETAGILLAFGADSAPISDDGQIPADLAAAAGHPELAERLRTC